MVSVVATFATIGTVAFIAMVLVSMLISFLNVMTLDLQSLENGCPAFSSDGKALDFVAFVTGLFGAAGVALGAWISFLTGGPIGSIVAACKR